MLFNISSYQVRLSVYPRNVYFRNMSRADSLLALTLTAAASSTPRRWPADTDRERDRDRVPGTGESVPGVLVLVRCSSRFACHLPLHFYPDPPSSSHFSIRKWSVHTHFNCRCQKRCVLLLRETPFVVPSPELCVHYWESPIFNLHEYSSYLSDSRVQLDTDHDTTCLP